MPNKGSHAPSTLHPAKDWVKVVEAVGIEPEAQRYANPTRTLGFPAYRCQPQATLPLTYVPCSTLESSCLPCALVIIWSLTISGWATVKCLVFERAGRVPAPGSLRSCRFRRSVLEGVVGRPETRSQATGLHAVGQVALSRR